jgi:hypothetical protein
VTLEHVHVHSSGQAAVGLVEPAGGGDRSRLEDQRGRRMVTGTPSSMPGARPRRLPAGARSQRSFAPCALWRAKSIWECSHG